MARNPIVFGTEVHCRGCGKKIKKALMKLNWVESVSFNVGYGSNGRVYVQGNANAETLRAEIRRKNDNKAVAILDYGGFDVEEDAPPQRSPPRASSPAPASRGGLSSSNYPAPPPLSLQSSRSSYYTPAYSPSPPRPPSNNYPPGGYYSYYAPPPPPPGGYYQPLADYYNYDMSRGGPHYVPNYAPTTFNDENPNACSIQ